MGNTATGDAKGKLTMSFTMLDVTDSRSCTLSIHSFWAAPVLDETGTIPITAATKFSISMSRKVA
jgi:hypothetical protein